MNRAVGILPFALVLAGCTPSPPIPRPPDPPSAAQSSPVPPDAARPDAAQPSAPEGSCPESGYRMQFGGGEAAMGLRVLGIELINCGHNTLRLNSFPVLTALDEDRAELDIDILDGVSGISASITGRDGPPKPVVLRRDERARAVLAWRNTYDDTRNPPASVVYLKVATAAGEPAEVLTPDGPLDLGSTGRLGVSPWLTESADSPR